MDFSNKNSGDNFDETVKEDKHVQYYSNGKFPASAAKQPHHPLTSAAAETSAALPVQNIVMMNITSTDRNAFLLGLRLLL